MLQTRGHMRLFRSMALLLLLVAAFTGSTSSAQTPPLPPDASGKLIVTFMGLKHHGLAIVISAPSGGVYLLDAGTKQEDHDAGRDEIAPLLKARGVQQIAGMVLTHPHADHFGGAPWLIDHFPVKCLVDSGFEGRGQSDSYRAIRKQAKDRGAEYIVVHAGDRLAWDESLDVEVLSPPGEFLLLDADPAEVSEHAVLNGNSLVLRIQHGKNVFLFPADAYGSEGSYLMKNWKPEKLKATVLCAPHHGFNSTPGYARVVRPEVVFASCLAHYDNSPIASPGDKAREIFEPVGAKVYSAAWHGNVQVISDGQTIQVTSWMGSRHQRGSR